MYVIHQVSRAPNPLGSYAGKLWDKAGLRESYKAFFSSREEAVPLAQQLNKVTPSLMWGFTVSEVHPESERNCCGV